MKTIITSLLLFFIIVCQGQTKKLNDIVKVNTEKLNWTQYNPPKNGQNILLSIPISSIKCLDYEFPSLIKGIRFNVTIMDAFNEILYTANNMTIEFQAGHYLGNSDSGFTNEITMVPRQSILIGSNTTTNERIKSLYNYSQQYSVKVICDISAIVLKNGDILK